MEYVKFNLQNMEHFLDSKDYPNATVCSQHSLAIFLEKPMSLISRKSILFSKRLHCPPNIGYVEDAIINKYAPRAWKIICDETESLAHFCTTHPTGTYRVVTRWPDENGHRVYHATIVSNGRNLDWFSPGFGREMMEKSLVYSYYHKPDPA